MIPTVTVLVDTYNHERFIEEALASVVEQDFPPSEMEILVVDDGSTDRTPEIVQKFGPRVRLLRKANGGQASAFNFGIPEARGEIVAFLDGDDWWARNKLSRVVEAMASDAEMGIVGHGIVIVHRDGSQQTEVLREGFRFRADNLPGAKLFRRRGAFLGTSRMTIRRELLGRIGLVPEAIRVQADEYLFTVASALTYVRILEEALTFYRLHEFNAFQYDEFDLERERHKQQVLAMLVSCLLERLDREGIEKKVREAALAYTQAACDRLRLVINGGWSWQTASAEWRLYAVSHPEASVTHRAFKALMLLGALVAPPKAYYRVQRRLSANAWYLRARDLLLPVPRMPHLRHSTEHSSPHASVGADAPK